MLHAIQDAKNAKQEDKKLFWLIDFVFAKYQSVFKFDIKLHTPNSEIAIGKTISRTRVHLSLHSLSFYAHWGSFDSCHH